MSTLIAKIQHFEDAKQRIQGDIDSHNQTRNTLIRKNEKGENDTLIAWWPVTIENSKK